jgi:hypothetical protein
LGLVAPGSTRQLDCSILCMATKKSSAAAKGKGKIRRVMEEHKEGTLKSHGKKVKSRKQAVAIALSEARKAGAKIPKKKAAS